MPRIRRAAIVFGFTLGRVLFLRQYWLYFSGDTVQRAAFNLLSGLRLEDAQFSWDKIPTTKELKWTACYDSDIQCARLEVPLDYSDPDGRKANIALIRKPAKVSANSESYRGPILFNPGGPGASGIDFVKIVADKFTKILGPQFDLVGFDPRGISRSTPTTSIFKSKAERALWSSGLPVGLGIANNTDEGVARTWARSSVVNKLAAETDDGYLRHINTENTARDMLRIVDAHGRDKLQYWGFSYGSVLGATFATLFPDKIDRLVIDGVTDAEDYYSTSWANSLVDTDKILNSFYTGCAEAGPEGCAFWAPTASDVAANLTRLFDSVRSRPIPLRTKTGYGLLDHTMLRFSLFLGLYQPYASFPALAEGFAELAAGNGTKLFDRVHPAAFQCECDQAPRPEEELPQFAVICNDGDEVPGDLVSAQEYFDRMVETSGWYDIWATIRLGCVNWPKLPKSKFRGPFNVTTSHPILLIGNSADPVTPIAGAKKMSEGFKGSVVLTQNSFGHCSLSAPSVCTQKHVRDYFVDGTLPDPDTVCDPVTSPFPSKSDQALVSAMTAEEQEMYAAVSALSQDSGVVAPINFKTAKATPQGCDAL